jgi:hypothetical protein
MIFLALPARLLGIKLVRAWRYNRARTSLLEQEHIAWAADLLKDYVSEDGKWNSKMPIPKDKRTHKRLGPFKGCDCLNCDPTRENKAKRAAKWGWVDV